MEELVDVIKFYGKYVPFNYIKKKFTFWSSLTITHNDVPYNMLIKTINNFSFVDQHIKDDLVNKTHICIEMVYENEKFSLKFKYYSKIYFEIANENIVPKLKDFLIYSLFENIKISRFATNEKELLKKRLIQEIYL